MIKCSNNNCGAENEDGAKFCEMCCTPLPQDKECPSCHSRVKLSAKFCAECGFNFNKQQVADKSGSMLSMGDKNVVAGDMVGSQENFKITGSATIIKNEDETKKTICCHVCGKHVPIIQSVTCPECNLPTCEDCIDDTLKICCSCIKNKQENKEQVYLQALQKILEDGKISLAEQQELRALQAQLGLSPDRVNELVKLAKAGAVPQNDSAELPTGAKLSLNKALDLLYDTGDIKSAYNLLQPLYIKFPQNEEVLTGYLDALSKINPEEVKNIVQKNLADIVGIHLVCIDLDLQNNDLISVEERIQAALDLWPDNLLIYCRKVMFFKAMADHLNESSLLEQATEMLLSMPEPKNKLESSYLHKVQCEIYHALGEEIPDTTEEYCKAHDLYFSLAKPDIEVIQANVKEVTSCTPDSITCSDNAHKSADKSNTVPQESKAETKKSSSIRITIPRKTEKDIEKIEADKKLGIIFADNDTVLVKYPRELQQKNYQIPYGIKHISKDAFFCCYNLTEIIIPNSVTSIGKSAFDGCKNLTSIVIPDSVTSIGEKAFQYCENLTEITIPNGVTVIENYLFYDCKSLENVIIPDSVTSIGEGAFQRCKKLTEITIPNGVTVIENYLFDDCESLENVIIPDSVKSIGERAFQWCRKLAHVNIPHGVVALGDCSFNGCQSFTSIVIPGSVKSIHKDAFLNCKNLQFATMANCTEEIKNSVFPKECTIFDNVEKMAEEIENWENIKFNAKSGDASAQRKLGIHHYKMRHWNEAAVWFQKAAEQNDAHSQYCLGLLYKVGLGVKENFEEAQNLFRQAAALGHQRALAEIK